MRAVEEGDIEVIDIWEDGDGPHDNTFVTSTHCLRYFQN
jgi:hypothetical protein